MVTSSIKTALSSQGGGVALAGSDVAVGAGGKVAVGKTTGVVVADSCGTLAHEVNRKTRLRTRFIFLIILFSYGLAESTV
jgi:hypothetical protein